MQGGSAGVNGYRMACIGVLADVMLKACHVWAQGGNPVVFYCFLHIIFLMAAHVRHRKENASWPVIHIAISSELELRRHKSPGTMGNMAALAG